MIFDDVSSGSLDDNLPPGTTFVSLVSPASWSCMTPNVGSNGSVKCTNATVPAGTNDVFTLTVHINAGVLDGTFITNVAKVAGTPNDDTENDESPATTQIISNQPSNVADLALTKTRPAQAHPNTDLTSTITVTNSSSNAASARSGVSGPSMAWVTVCERNNKIAAVIVTAW